MPPAAVARQVEVRTIIEVLTPRVDDFRLLTSALILDLLTQCVAIYVRYTIALFVGAVYLVGTSLASSVG